MLSLPDRGIGLEGVIPFPFPVKFNLFFGFFTFRKHDKEMYVIIVFLGLRPVVLKRASSCDTPIIVSDSLLTQYLLCYWSTNLSLFKIEFICGTYRPMVLNISTKKVKTQFVRIPSGTKIILRTQKYTLNSKLGHDPPIENSNINNKEKQFVHYIT